MIDDKRIKRFIEGAKEAFNEVDDPTFTFPMNILSAYELARSIEELLKEQPEIVRCKDCRYCEYTNAEREWCKKGHLHGNAETWFCADGEQR